ncbi:MAG: PH domain-containing protein [Patescibacteria group bacterium]
MEEKYFSASMTSGIKIGTYIVWALALAVLVGSIVAIYFINLQSFYLAPALLYIILFITYRYRPLGYVVTSKEIHIKRPIGDYILLREQVASIERYKSPGMSFSTNNMRFASIRLFGSGGFYGGYGLFWNKAWGKFYAYVTRTDTLVLITPKEGSGQRVLISPDDPDGFIAATQQA